ncbi:alpha/beta hydrolase [Rhodococcus sp. HNM0569]|uniref:alpha/beta hydrolase n=1 Tax=Rhodococcus sp. HNM0569 TaxID=2716340 RepID=UPI00146A91D4|nr:alpha/beta hydrolase [Rhodococcus sp. HNM0569]NLU82996.1 alpha/beta hydrolase [Rhodococcus sp. HNM0569]
MSTSHSGSRRVDLDPEVENMLAALEAGFPDVTAFEPAALREMIRSRRGGVGSEPAMRSVEDFTIDGPGGAVPVRIYRPHSERERMPVVVFAHGGGFVFCDLDSHDETCRSIADQVDAVVVSVDYRLAPEHRGPAAMEDVYAALVWVHENVDALGGRADRVAVAGDSAGGNLAATVSLAARDRGGPAVAAQFLLYPVIDDDFDTGSYREYGTGYYNTEAAMRWYWSHYAPGGSDDPYVVPTKAADLGGLPRAVVVTAELDPLRDGGERYAALLSDAGGDVRVHRCDGLFHGFLAFPVLAAAVPAREKIWQMMRDALA